MSESEPFGLHSSSWRFLRARRGQERYVEASKGSARELSPASTRRQFVTAADVLRRLNGSNGEAAQKGLLLADDVGLGKTTVAALVAWIAASAGQIRVRILAPNAVMQRRWASELDMHVPLLKQCAPRLGVDPKQIKPRKVGALRQGQIQITTHFHASKRATRLDCELLIVDEAHRAKGESSKFARSLAYYSRRVKRLLVLTATPFSIHITELERMLRIVGADASIKHVREFDRICRRLYGKHLTADALEFARQLVDGASAAVDAIRRVVIRHSVENLPRERKAFGDPKTVKLPGAKASSRDLEVLVRADRLFRDARRLRPNARAQTNDARFHVGWAHLDKEIKELTRWLDENGDDRDPTLKLHLDAVRNLRRRSREHPKARVVANWVAERARSGEKVVVFCHHHATAREIAIALSQRLRRSHSRPTVNIGTWRKVWKSLLRSELEHRSKAYPSSDDLDDMFAVYLDWLCSPLIQSQIESWAQRLSKEEQVLRKQLSGIRARHPRGPLAVRAAADLFLRLTDPESKSTRGVLRAVRREAERADALELLPGGGHRSSPVLALCESENDERYAHLFNKNRQPDTALAVFNSPYGPDVLVTTDRLSEGIDLHTCCRIIVHYELDPSPVRTIQRNGRLRRINGWATQIGLPIEVAYPAFKGTRDERLVEIMERRLRAFSLLLGGVSEIRTHEDGWEEPADEDWRNKVLSLADKNKKFSKLSTALVAR